MDELNKAAEQALAAIGQPAGLSSHQVVELAYRANCINRAINKVMKARFMAENEIARISEDNGRYPIYPQESRKAKAV